MPGICLLVFRLVALGFTILLVSVDYCLTVFLKRGENISYSRLGWVQRSSRSFLRVLNLEVSSRGMPPRRGLMVSNHLGYLDIIVYSSISPMIFVSKHEVRDWPVFGWLSACAGTLFINRGRKQDVERVTGEMAHALSTGVVVALFPEGTSSDGRGVLPFRSSLLEPAASKGWPVCPACLTYRVAGGSAETDACYWGKMSFLPHLMKLLSKKAVYASVVFGTPVDGDSDRKLLASRLHREVVALRQSFYRGSTNATGEALQGLAR
jgi:1-acyl-sn-glycerol-3-phosphate acyltransferase